MARIQKNLSPAYGVSEAPVGPFHVQLQVGQDGRVLIPVEMRRLMKLGADGKVNAEIIDGELKLFSPAVALEKLQSLFDPVRGSGSIVDELLAERRAEAARE